MENIRIFYEYRYNQNGILTYVNEYHQVLDVSQIPIKEDIVYDIDENNIKIIKEIKKEEVWFSERMYQYAKLIENEVVELDNNDKKLLNLIALEDGEIVKEGKIINIPRPSDIYKWENEVWLKSEELILSKKKEINDRTYDEICEVYPLWKQNNIQIDFALYGDKTELEKMNLFILQARAESDNEFYEVIK